MRRRYTITSLKEIFAETGRVLLEDHYQNNKTPMQYRCHCGTEAHIVLQEFLRGSRCGCGRKKEAARKKTLDRVCAQIFSEPALRSTPIWLCQRPQAYDPHPAAAFHVSRRRLRGAARRRYEYQPKYLTRCYPLSGMCCVSSARKSSASKT